MAVSRRLRFEVLKRDNYTCRYCGAKAPDVTLTVDHVIPTALGGSDEPANLVTACKPCNGGKASVSPDSSVVHDVAADALRWARAIDIATGWRRAELADLDKVVEEFGEAWAAAFSGYYPYELQWPSSIERFVSLGLNADDLLRYIDVVNRRRLHYKDRWPYFCGCCWKEINRRQDVAKAILDAEAFRG
jgi:hypothetical protein